jgi:hypothetical protein
MIDPLILFWWIFLGVLGYIFISDRNVIDYCILLFKLLQLNVIRFFMGIKLRARLEYDRFILKQRMKKYFNK